MRERTLTRARLVALAGAVLGLVLVAAMLGTATTGLLWRHLMITLAGVGALGFAAWQLAAGLVRRGRQRGWRGAVLSALCGIAALLVGALSLGLASLLRYAPEDRAFGLMQAVWDYFCKPALSVAIFGCLPAALIGLICWAVFSLLERRAAS